MTWLLAVAAAAAAVPAGLRWLRVAQREHYLPGEVTRFALRWWWQTGLPNSILDAAAFIGTVFTVFDPRFALAVPVVAVVGPIGLSTKGVTSPLAWTDRLRRLALLSGMILLGLFVAGALLDQPLLVVIPLYLISGIIDLSLWALRPYEERKGDEWVEKATAKLTSIAPAVVAITGSYGKTTTKNYVAHLLSGSHRVVASPASFNNRMGLARAINENLTPGTEIFVAEMGTYGYGEIAELCTWIRPKVAAMVSIGPVHLERFGTLEDIARAKSEILDRAEVGVICVDYPQLAEIAAERSHSMRIIEVTAKDGIVVDGEAIMPAPAGVFGANLAVALGICKALGADSRDIAGRIGDLPTAEHRQSIMESPRGFKIVDDTFNSNPVGARSAVRTLVGMSDGGKTAVITPGMVELGSVQDEENRKFAALAADQVDHFVIVGRTNRAALEGGSANRRASVTVVGSRAEAVSWAVANLGPGDAVLYENDLPDHYP
ncbi:MAG: Mur ligase family protein [Acidimicrobiia bacterium]|jgi:UDP-N-acetylmuramoyl-tripeptide--D-alanyl-D-alanine ligase